MRFLDPPESAEDVGSIHVDDRHEPSAILEIPGLTVGFLVQVERDIRLVETVPEVTHHDQRLDHAARVSLGNVDPTSLLGIRQGLPVLALEHEHVGPQDENPGPIEVSNQPPETIARPGEIRAGLLQVRGRAVSPTQSVVRGSHEVRTADLVGEP